MTTDTSPILPGRLSSPDMAIRDDPRADPRMIAALAPFGLDVIPAPPPVNNASPLDQFLEFLGALEHAKEDLFSKLMMDLPPVEGVTSHQEVIKGIDDNDITLLIHRPTDVSSPLPGILHLHGGGMVETVASGFQTPVASVKDNGKGWWTRGGSNP